MNAHDADLARASLVPLSSLRDVRLAAGEPDIRGWHLIGTDGHPLGVVEELLVDARTDEVAALAIAAGGALSVLPMRAAEIDPGRRVVQAALTREQFAALPRGAVERPVTGADAGRARAHVADRAADHPGVTVERTADGGEVVRVPIVEEELVVERRPVVKEVLVIRKRAVRDEQVVEADLRREQLHVDRRSGDV